MKIIHTLTFPNEPKIKNQLALIGISSRDSMILNFQISENDPLWPKVAGLCTQYDPVDIINTTFSRSELKQSDYLVMLPSWHHGYPMPDDDFGFLSVTFDTTDYCTACGIGRQQNKPFIMKSEPKWGKRSIVQLNWIFDEYFVKPEVYLNVFKPFGIESREVLHNKTYKPLTSVVQLVINESSLSSMAMDNHPFEKCRACGCKKFLPFTKGPFPAFLKSPGDANIFKTQEIFGSGNSANREIVVTQELYQSMYDSKIKGVDFQSLEKGTLNKAI